MKIVVAGGFAVGKTTFVGAVSEIAPLRTEAVMSAAGARADRPAAALARDPAALAAKTTTTVAMDFGRRALGGDLYLYLFGTPGQDRFWFMWDDVARGALGAVVLVDTHRLADGFAAVDWFERRDMPFVVAVNCFEGRPPHRPGDVRAALDLPDGVPLVYTDARVKDRVKDVLVRLLRHAIARASA